MLRLVPEWDPRQSPTGVLRVTHSTNGAVWSPHWSYGRTEGVWEALGDLALAHRAGLVPAGPPESALEWTLGEVNVRRLRSTDPGPPDTVVGDLIEAAGAWLNEAESVIVVHVTRVPAVIAESGLHRMLLLDLVRMMVLGRENLRVIVSIEPRDPPVMAAPVPEGTHTVLGAAAWRMPGMSPYPYGDPRVCVGFGADLRGLTYGDLNLEPWLKHARAQGI